MAKRITAIVLLALIESCSALWEWKCENLQWNFHVARINCPEGSFVKSLSQIKPDRLIVQCFEPDGTTPTKEFNLNRAHYRRSSFLANDFQITEELNTGCETGPLLGIKIITNNAAPTTIAIPELLDKDISVDRRILSMQPICVKQANQQGVFVKPEFECNEGGVCGFRVSYFLAKIGKKKYERRMFSPKTTTDTCYGMQNPWWGPHIFHKSILKITPKCCPVNVLICTPVEESKLVGSCNNTLSLQKNRICTFTQRIGISRSTTTSKGGHNSVTNTTSSSEGWTWNADAGQELFKFFKMGFSKNFGSSIGDSKASGYNWNNANQENWNSESTTSASYNAPPGITSKVFQLIGNCGGVTVQTNMFTFVDYDKHGKVIKV